MQVDPAPPPESLVGAIILAAGCSSRMAENKLALDLAGKPIIAHVADAISSAGLPAPIVVLGHEAERIRAALGRRPAHYVTAGDYQLGMARSLAAGIAAVPADWTGALICLGDMPLLDPALLRRMARKPSPSAIILPQFQGRRGNPVLWGSDFFPELQRLQGGIGGKALFSRYADQVDAIEWEDDSVCLDIDTPEALRAARDRLDLGRSR